MNYYSVHLYGANVQLLQLGSTFEESKSTLLEIMKGVDFDYEEDGVNMFEMQPNGEGKAVFSFEEYLQEQEEAEK
jgi:guanyl-specific ribonuclease Sa